MEEKGHLLIIYVQVFLYHKCRIKGNPCSTRTSQFPYTNPYQMDMLFPITYVATVVSSTAHTIYI